MLAQVLLTFVLLLMMGKARVGAVQRGEVRVADIALGERVWPRPVQQISNNLQNQFETPILFFVLCGIAILLGATGYVMTVLAWAYVGTRMAHSYVHVTSNRVGSRFRIFAIGFVVLAAMWIVLVARLLFGI